MGGKPGKHKKKKGDKGEKNTSETIDSQLWKDKEKAAEVIKLLLLGAGESGKSTLFKQMKNIYCGGFSDKDLGLHIPVILNNTIAAMQTLVARSNELTIDCEIKGEEAKKAAAEISQISPESEMSPEVAGYIKTLWADEGIRNTFAQRAKFHIVDSVDYFFDNIDRISAEDYVPVPMDLVCCRIRTTGIVENQFVIDDNKFIMVDVGGQRNERKKWIHCFEGVTAVIFVVAISAYDMVLYEDGKTKRMDEALQLFKQTADSRWFRNTSFILFLNKSDLFYDKIQKVPFTVWKSTHKDDIAHPYTGDPHDPSAVIEYIKACFERRYKNEHKLYIHVTCATNEDNVQAVFTAVKDIIIQQHLADSGLM